MPGEERNLLSHVVRQRTTSRSSRCSESRSPGSSRSASTCRSERALTSCTYSPPDAFDLDAFLCSDNGELSNLQTKLLLGRPIEGLSASEAVDIALGNLLETITCFGIQEHFDESLALIAWTLGIKPAAYGSRNQRDSTRALRFDGSHLDKIIELNAIDLELYERARQSFMQRTGLAACRP